MKGTKPITKKSAIENEPAAISSNETDEEVENIRNRT
jgi:hypothetical protein